MTIAWLVKTAMWLMWPVPPCMNTTVWHAIHGAGIERPDRVQALCIVASLVGISKVPVAERTRICIRTGLNIVGHRLEGW